MPRTERFAALDAWRGICAVIVALGHLTVDSVLKKNVFVGRGFRFVDFFFVLSGFVIAHAYRERLQIGKSEVRAFLVRRVGRLWPLHAAVLAALVIFQMAVFAASRAGLLSDSGSMMERNTLESLLPNILLVHAWGFMRYPSWNNPSWSISTELFAYGLFAACCMLGRRSVDYLAAAIVIGAALLLGWFIPRGMTATYDYGLIRCVFGFMIGVLTRRIWEHTSAPAGTVAEFAAVLAVIAGVVYLPFDVGALLISPLFALVVWIFASEGGSISRLLKRSTPQSLGRWSYSIYMIHAPIVLGVMVVGTICNKMGLKVVARVGADNMIVGPGWITAGVAAVYIVVVILCARLTYRLIELPGQRVFVRWTSRTSSRA